MSNQESNLQNEHNEDHNAVVKHKAMEGEGMGGHNFGGEGKPTMGDDKDNPSQNAGYTNGYFARTGPSDEDTANNNFKAEDQQGKPDYDAAQQEIHDPGPQELPEQQKVGEDAPTQQQDNTASGSETDNSPSGEPETAYQEPGLGNAQPDHGSDVTETGEDPDEFQK